jgi:tetratricopeptide (TPR) repeat protein
MNFVERAFWSHEEANRARTLAKSKQIESAIKVAKDVINSWSKSPGFLERQMRKVSINGLLSELTNEVKDWENKAKEATNLSMQADAALEKSDSNPWQIDNLSKALDLYQKSLAINQEVNCKTNQGICQHKLKEKQNYQKYFNQGQKKVEAKYYSQALEHFKNAQTIFSRSELTEKILFCQKQIIQEKQYQTMFYKAKKLTKEGYFSSAITCLKTAYQKFPREDGKQFIDKLQGVITAKQNYKQGLLAEQQGKWKIAKQYYSQVRENLPNLTEDCTKRLAILAIKTEQWSLALQEINKLEGKEAHYLRGFIYAKQGKYKEANHEWKAVSKLEIKSEIEILKTFVHREKLSLMQQIEAAVEQENLEHAKALSQQFLEQYGTNSVVEYNFYQHIEARITNLNWETLSWEKLAQRTEALFLEKKDITSLHNWAIATYYQAQVHPEKMGDWITAWCCAITNLSNDPALKNIPWLGSETIDFKQLSKDLKNFLISHIDEIKEENLNQYFKLRDQYRMDIAALEHCLTINGLKITPSCYQHYQKYFPSQTLSNTWYGALYTNFGQSVAACLNNDIKRTFAITPTVANENPAAEHGKAYVAYHQGIYYLQNQQWRKGRYILHSARHLIQNNPDWKDKIDRICEEIRYNISHQEALDFAQFWYTLLGSNSAKSYYVEQKTNEIRNQLSNEKITLREGKNKLNELRKIDQNNVTLLELYKQVTRIEEELEISRLLDDGNLELAVRKARSSQDEKIRYMVAEICIKILIEGVKSQSLYRENIIELGRWAYNLCPNEPDFYTLYRELGLR